MSIYELGSGSAALAVRGSREIMLVDGRPMLLDVPHCDTQEFSSLSSEERARIRAILDAFRLIASSRTIQYGAHQASQQYGSLGRGFSAKTLADLYRAYREGGHKPGDVRKLGAKYQPGDWRILCRDYSGKDKSLPPEFVAWLTSEWAQYKGRSDCHSALWRHIIQDIWLLGKSVPGYGTIEDWSRTTGRARPHPLLVRPGELPEGWSLSTFRRALPKRQSTRAQVFGGYLAAHTHQPDMVMTDRGELRPMQYIYIDDWRPDMRCLHFSGRIGEFVYPLMVVFLEASCSIDTANVGKPRCRKRAEAEDSTETSERHGVTRDMVVQGIVNTLREFGIPEGYPVTFVHELSGGCVPPAAKDFIKEIYGERILFMSTGMFRDKMSQYGFIENGGQPWAKGQIEVFFRLLGTQIANLKLSTGPRYDSTPAENEAIEKYTLGLVKQVGGIEEIIRKLALPALTFDQAYDAIVRTMHMLRFRTNHKLQGFDRVSEWRRDPSDNYHPIEELHQLSTEEQDQVSDIIQRLECPAERFVRLARKETFTPVDEDLLCWLEGMHQVRKVTIRNGKIAVRDQSLSDDELVYREEDHTYLDEDFEGKTFDAVIAHGGDRIVLGKDGRILCHIERQLRVDRGDQDAIKREQIRVRNARISSRQAFEALALGDANDALQRMRLQNTAVIAEQQALQGGAAAVLGAPSRRINSKKEQSSTDILVARAAKAAKAGILEDEA